MGAPSGGLYAPWEGLSVTNRGYGRQIQLTTLMSPNVPPSGKLITQSLSCTVSDSIDSSREELVPQQIPLCNLARGYIFGRLGRGADSYGSGFLGRFAFILLTRDTPHPH
jgi:hypothetical protein